MLNCLNVITTALIARRIAGALRIEVVHSGSTAVQVGAADVITELVRTLSSSVTGPDGKNVFNDVVADLSGMIFLLLWLEN